MDLTTIVGILSGIFLVIYSIMSAGSLSLFVNVPSMLIVVGGTIAATLINFPLREVIGVLGVVKKAFLHKDESFVDIISTLVKFAEMTRREGVLALERQLGELDEGFMKKGVQLAIDGTEPEILREILDTDLNYLGERHGLGQDIFNAMGAFSPAFGMVGTLIGLILMLATMEDPSTIGPSMAVALITTFYGALLANLIFLPIAGKLKTRSKEELLKREMMVEGILAIQSGDNPRVVEQKLTSFIPPKLRGKVSTKQS